MHLHTSQELVCLSKREKNPHKRIRLLAVSLFIERQNRANVARQLKVSRGSVNTWVSRYLEFGLAGLEDKPRHGRQPFLSQKQHAELANYIQQQSLSDEGGRLTGEQIKHYISKQYDVDYHLNHIYKLLSKLGFSWITSRSRHPKQSQVAQDEFKKTTN